MTDENKFDNIQIIATQTATDLGNFVEWSQISPAEVVIGGLRGSVVFFMGCTQDGSRTDALNMLRQIVNEEIDNLIRGIANGMVPA